MIGKFAQVTLLVDDVTDLVEFYRDVLEFPILRDLGDYVELMHASVRFAICTRSLMAELTDHAAYQSLPQGQSVSLAFPLATAAQVESVYAFIVVKGAVPIQSPTETPWGHYAAFFADPAGYIHEIFAPLPEYAAK